MMSEDKNLNSYNTVYEYNTRTSAVSCVSTQNMAVRWMGRPYETRCLQGRCLQKVDVTYQENYYDYEQYGK